MIAPLLDTHAWVWWVQGDRRLGAREAAALDRLPPGNRPAISCISLWEVATLVSLKRIEMDTSFTAWLERAASPRTVRILPLTAAVAAEVAALPDTFHRDPADRVIVASCRLWGLPLLSRDRRITSSRLTKRWSVRD